jgi:multidrug efflux pump subunit AcrA (membrane-fusion protein)
MRSQTRMRGIATVLGGCLVLLLQACSGRPGESREVPAGDQSVDGRVVLNADAVRTAGIKTDTAQVRDFYPAVKASGTVALNQKKYVKVTPRIAGRVEKVLAFEGDLVRTGQELFWLWSPELMAAQAEFFQILSRVPAEGRSPVTDDEKLHEGLLRSSEAKLRTMGFGDGDLAALRKSGQPLPVLAVRAPITGTVVEAEAAVGTSAEVGTCLCTIADLTSLWVVVNIFEADLASVAVGDRTEIAVTAYPGRTFPGSLVLVGAFVDEATRTVKGRVEMANASGKLKPGMYGEVRIVARTPVRMLAVPESAVRTMGGKTVVFLSAAGGAFLRRDVRTGRTFEGFVEILEGLREGDRVVTDGSFEIKAEMLKGTLEGNK